MNSKQIREVLEKIQSEVTCPKCKKRINPKDIKIEHHDKETCTLKITCTPCTFTFGGQAMFKEHLTPIGKKMNASSRMKHKKDIHQKISAHDKQSISNTMKKTKKISPLL